MCLISSLNWSSTVSSVGIVQWDFTRRDHPGNLGMVSGSGLVKICTQRIKVWCLSLPHEEHWDILLLNYFIKILMVSHINPMFVVLGCC